MLKLLKTLKNSKLAVFAIIALLFAQAWCELALPAYMSDIVDIGLQANGVEHISMTEMNAETYCDLQMFMTVDEAVEVNEYYTLEGERYVLGDITQEQRVRLDELFGIPMLTLSFARHGIPDTAGAQDAQMPSLEQFRQMNSMSYLTDEFVLDSRESITGALDELGMTDMLVGQVATALVGEEYRAMGFDMDGMQQRYLWWQGTKMLGLTLASVLAAIAVGLLASQVGAKIGLDLRSSLFQKVVSFSGAEIDRFSTASLVTRSTSDISNVQMTLIMMLRMVFYAPILGIGGVIRVLSTRTGMSWIIAVAIGLILVLMSLLTAISMPKFKLMQTLLDRVNLVAREILTGLPVIRAFSRERHEEKRLNRAGHDLMKNELFAMRVMSMTMPILALIMNGLTLAIIWFGAHRIDMGSMQVGDMMAFITYTMQIVMSFLMLSMMFFMVPRAIVSARRINEVLDTEATINDPALNLDDKLSNVNKGMTVVFNNVSFRYPDAEADVLENITFTAEPGKTTAIIGSTGSGKSTLLNLLPRFYDVTGGEILLDGTDIRKLSQKALRSKLGYVPQKGVLFSGDIESNIKFGDEHISDDEMTSAARIAQASDFIDEKPEGYQSPIAQGGSNVSGGQKQRLSIARAVAKNPQVYLFDDSFSALDYKTDVTLRRALSEHTADATVIIVAQRISTILHADRIVVLDEGSVAGIGTHQELLKGCKTYLEIARSQLSDSELGGVGA